MIPVTNPYSFMMDVAKQCNTEDVVRIEDAEFLLSSLPSEEEAELYIGLANGNDPRRGVLDRVGVLCYAIKGVNKNKFKYVSIEDKDDRKKERDIAIKELKISIGKWQDGVIEYLYKKYIEISVKTEVKTKQFKLREI